MHHKPDTEISFEHVRSDETKKILFIKTCYQLKLEYSSLLLWSDTLVSHVYLCICLFNIPFTVAFLICGALGTCILNMKRKTVPLSMMQWKMPPYFLPSRIFSFTKEVIFRIQSQRADFLHCSQFSRNALVYC